MTRKTASKAKKPAKAPAKPETQVEAIDRVRTSVERLVLEYPNIQQQLGAIYERLKIIQLSDDAVLESVMRNRTFQAQLGDATNGISIWVSVCQLLTRGLVSCQICKTVLPTLLWWQRRASPYCSRDCRKEARRQRMTSLLTTRTGVRQLADTTELVANVTSRR